MAFAVPDVRFVNECKILKEKKFFIIKLIRDSELKINHISETNQNSIPDEEFDYIVYNNKTLDKLSDQAKQIFDCLKKIKNQ